MGDITIKIPQDTSGSFEITDRDVAEKILCQIKKSSEVKKRPAKKNQKDFTELSALADKWRSNPDVETNYAIKTAEEWRRRWDR